MDTMNTSSSPNTMQSHNDTQLTRTMLHDLLDDLQERILQAFGCQIRLFVHGGAVMILHPMLSSSSTRRTTRDVDYIRRAFGHEWRKKGVYDAEERLQSCINATALRFRIGSDWMNADPDVALPFARDPQGHIYDPIYYDAKQRNNVEMNTIYSSAGLILVSVTMFWGVALKLVRYRKEDPTDIVAMLRHGTKLNGVHWTPDIMEGWIKTLCWPMGYDKYQPQRMDELRDRIRDAVRLLQNSPGDIAPKKNYAQTARPHHQSMHVSDGHRTQSSHSHSPPRVRPAHTSSDLAVVPYHQVAHVRSPFGSPTDAQPFPMLEPWRRIAPMVPNARTF